MNRGATTMADALVNAGDASSRDFIPAQRIRQETRCALGTLIRRSQLSARPDTCQGTGRTGRQNPAGVGSDLACGATYTPRPNVATGTGHGRVNCGHSNRNLGSWLSPVQSVRWDDTGGKLCT